MGNIFGTDSTNTSSIVTGTALSVTQKAISRCVTSATQSQLIAVKNVVGDVTISGVSFNQGASVNAECVFSADMQSEIMSEIASQISQYAEANGIALLSLLSSTSATVESAVENIFEANVDLETLQEEVTQSLQEQAITVADVGGSVIIADVTMDQSIEMMAKGMMSSSGYSSSISTVQTAVDQATKATDTNPLDKLFETIKSSVQSYALIILGVVIAGAVAFIFLSKYIFTTDTGKILVQEGAKIGSQAISRV